MWPLFVGALPTLKLGLSLGVASYYARLLEQRIRHSARWKQLNALVNEYRGLSFGDPDDALKYFALDYWLRDNIQRAVRINVHGRPRMKILDLGCGSGLFPFVCRFSGHDAVGLDKPITACRPAEAIVYSIMPETLGVPVTRSVIRAQERMEVNERYDLITAFMICFNQHKQPNEWGRGEWEFFLSDAATKLNPGGTVHLSFNRHDERYGPLRYWDRETLSIFEACGEVDRASGTATFNRESIIRTLSGSAEAIVAVPCAAEPPMVPVQSA